MKKTTYILLGVILSGAVFIIVTIVWMHFHAGKNSTVNVAGAVKTIDLPSAKALIFEFENDSLERKMNVDGEVDIRQAKEGEKASFSYPSDFDKYMEVSTTDSVIVVKFKDVFEVDDYSILKSAEKMKVVLPASVKEIRNSMWLSFNINGYTNDSLDLTSFGDTKIDNLFVKDLKLNQGGAYNMNSGRAENLHIASRFNWQVNVGKFIVDTEYLCGGNMDIQKGECKKVVFVPVDTADVLSIKIVEPATIMINE